MNDSILALPPIILIVFIRTHSVWSLMNATSVTVRPRYLFLTQVYLLSPGQHDCVTVINNFFSRAKLEYYTIRQGLEKEPKLPPKLAGPLHKIIMSTNLNPVKVKYHHRCLWATLWNSGFGVKY